MIRKIPRAPFAHADDADFAAENHAHSEQSGAPAAKDDDVLDHARR